MRARNDSRSSTPRVGTRNKRRGRRFAIATAVLLGGAAAGCGGGGGGDDAEFAGVWYGGASLVDDSCRLIPDFQSFISFTHLINQDGNDLVLDNGALTFTGSVTGERSFSVSTSRSTAAAGESCTETIVWRYEEVKRNDAPFVVRKSTVECPSGLRCENTFSGSAFRSTSSGGGPVVPLGEDGAPADGITIDQGIGNGTAPVPPPPPGAEGVPESSL